MELPRKEGDGAPAGVKDRAEGGGPAGVVEGSVPKLNRPVPRGFSGVDISDWRPREENGFDMVVSPVRVNWGWREASSGLLGADGTRLERHGKTELREITPSMG